MDAQKIFVGIILLGLGALFFFNNKRIGEGAFKFYRKLYTKKNLAFMFRGIGVLLILIAVLLMFID